MQKDETSQTLSNNFNEVFKMRLEGETSQPLWVSKNQASNQISTRKYLHASTIVKPQLVQHLPQDLKCEILGAMYISFSKMSIFSSMLIP